MATKRRCKAKTKAGKRCRNGAAVDGVCLAHAPKEIQAERGFGGRQPGSGRPRKPRPDEILRERIEADIDRWLAPIEAALEQSRPLQVWSQADGEHRIVYVADPAVALKAVKFAFERAFGRPRQQVELAGEGGGPAQISAELMLSEETREAAHNLVCAVAKAREERAKGGTS